jgi:uncharacterized protein YihD (DUF1040 family)
MMVGEYGEQMSDTEKIYEIIQLFNQLENQESREEVIDILKKIADGSLWKE